MGILWASNSHPPQRDLAHGCSRSDPGLSKTALLWFWLPAFQAWDARLEIRKPSPRLLRLPRRGGRMEHAPREPLASLGGGFLAGAMGKTSP